MSGCCGTTTMKLRNHSLCICFQLSWIGLVVPVCAVAAIAALSPLIVHSTSVVLGRSIRNPIGAIHQFHRAPSAVFVSHCFCTMRSVLISVRSALTILRNLIDL